MDCQYFIFLQKLYRNLPKKIFVNLVEYLREYTRM